MAASLLLCCLVSVWTWSVLEWLQLVISYSAIVPLCKWTSAMAHWCGVVKTSRKRNKRHITCDFITFIVISLHIPFTLHLDISVQYTPSTTVQSHTIHYSMCHLSGLEILLSIKNHKNPNFKPRAMQNSCRV